MKADGGAPKAHRRRRERDICGAPARLTTSVGNVEDKGCRRKERGDNRRASGNRHHDSKTNKIHGAQRERSETAARGTRGDEERKRRKRKRSAAGRRKGERSEMKKRTEAGAGAKKGA